MGYLWDIFDIQMETLKFDIFKIDNIFFKPKDSYN